MAKNPFQIVVQAGLSASRKYNLAASAWFFSFLVLTAVGHPEFSVQVAEITARIEQEPANPDLYLHRADLRRQEGQFDEAMSDVATAARLKRDWPRVSLVRGQIQFDAGHPEEALRSVEKFLRDETNHAPALLLRARCHRKLGRLNLAVADYDIALKLFAQPNPDLFVERAKVEAALGRFDSAIAGLDEGMHRLGGVPGLQMAAIDMERQTGRFDAALRRIEAMALEVSSLPEDLLLKAEVLEQAGRLGSAREVFDQVIKATGKSQRQTGLTLAIRQNAEYGLIRIRQKLSQK